MIINLNVIIFILLKYKYKMYKTKYNILDLKLY